MAEQSKRAKLKNLTQRMKALTYAFERREIPRLNHRHFDVMRTPKALQLIGMKDLPIQIDGTVLKKIMEYKHADQISAETIVKLPNALHDPLMIFRAKDKNGHADPNRCIVVTDLKDRFGGTIIVPIIQDVLEDYARRGAIKRCHKIMSFYGKSFFRSKKVNNHFFFERMNNDDLLYINKKRTANWLKHLAEAPRGLLVGDSFDLSPIIPDETDLRKFEAKNLKQDFRRPLPSKTIVTREQQDRLDALYGQPMDTTRPEKIYRLSMMDKLNTLPTLTLNAVHQAERETIAKLVEKGITKSRIKKILQERSPLCNTKQSKQDLEEILGRKTKRFIKE